MTWQGGVVLMVRWKRLVLREVEVPDDSERLVHNSHPQTPGPGLVRVQVPLGHHHKAPLNSLLQALDGELIPTT